MLSLPTFMLAGIKEILIINTSTDTPRFEEELGVGSQLGMRVLSSLNLKPIKYVDK